MNYQEIIKLNNEEYNMILIEYIKLYIKSLILNIRDKDNRKVLIDKLKEYKKIISLENNYLKYFSINKYRINEVECDIVLNYLDELNEITYKYFDSIIEEYEIELNIKSGRNILPYRSFKTLLEDEYIKDIVIGLTLSRDDLFNYYSNVTSLDYIKERTRILNVDVELAMDFFGCFPIEVEGILTDIKVCVPKIYNLKSILINIHEYNHAIELYKYLGTQIPNIDFELLARTEEELFIKKYVRQKCIIK